LADENARTGTPLMRPLFYEFPEALQSPCEQPNAFLLGSLLLIAPPPHFESAAAYSVCLPAGGWYEYWSGLKVAPDPPSGARASQPVQLTPSLEELPVFVRAGAILPSQPLVQSTAQTPDGPLTLDVYPGDDCHGVIYLDDGHSIAYRSGAFLRQSVLCSTAHGQLEIRFEAREGSFTPWWTRMIVRVHDWTDSAAALKAATLNGRSLPVRRDEPAHSVEVMIDDQARPATLTLTR
jgi:alpha-glucosidase